MALSASRVSKNGIKGLKQLRKVGLPYSKHKRVGKNSAYLNFMNHNHKKKYLNLQKATKRLIKNF